MKFKKQANVAFFSKYVREDGKYTITSVYRRINGTLKMYLKLQTNPVM